MTSYQRLKKKYEREVRRNIELLGQIRILLKDAGSDQARIIESKFHYLFDIEDAIMFGVGEEGCKKTMQGISSMIKEEKDES